MRSTAGLMPVRSLFAGVCAHYVGAPLTVTLMGAIVIVLAFLIAWRAPVVRGPRRRVAKLA